MGVPARNSVGLPPSLLGTAEPARPRITVPPASLLRSIDSHEGMGTKVAPSLGTKVAPSLGTKVAQVWVLFSTQQTCATLVPRLVRRQASLRWLKSGYKGGTSLLS